MAHKCVTPDITPQNSSGVQVCIQVYPSLIPNTDQRQRVVCIDMDVFKTSGLGAKAIKTTNSV